LENLRTGERVEFKTKLPGEIDMKDEVLAIKRRELVDVASAMLKSDTDLIHGVRQTCRLRFEIQDPDNPVFPALRGVESETDSLPIGPSRSAASATYLQRADAEMQQYPDEAKPAILNACHDIIKMFSGSSGS
jgi:hypothetical protein